MAPDTVTVHPFAGCCSKYTGTTVEQRRESQWLGEDSIADSPPSLLSALRAGFWVLGYWNAFSLGVSLEKHAVKARVTL